MSKILDTIYEKAKRFKIDDNSKIVIMSDCHRGAGDNFDNFIKNQNIFESSLFYYYNKGFTYVELGDGDDMWEVSNYDDIVEEHLSIFNQLKKFNDSGKLIMLYGNHDICKKEQDVLEKHFYKHYNKKTKKEELLLNNLKVYESLIFEYNGHEILLIHGHQVDLLNKNFWKLSRFLVRHVWKKLEHIGFKDLTNAAKNYPESKIFDKKLKDWSLKNNKMIIAGHTHRPVFPKPGYSLYFNDGSCIHPNGITCLEIENGHISLVKWSFELKNGKYISVGRSVVEEKVPIIDFFK